MNRNDLYKAICFPLLLLAVLFSKAQKTITVKATVDRNKILIGEKIHLTLEADIPEEKQIRFFAIDSLSHFEIQEREKTDTSNTSDGTFLKQILVITSFDSGHWVIPAMALGDGITTDSIPIDVGYSEFDRTQPYHDIKDIIEVKPKLEKKIPWWWYAVGGAGLLLIILLIWFLARRKKPVVAVPVVEIDPYEEAMKSLGKLQSERPDQKQYYSRLVDIFRLYIDKRKGIQSLQKTTDDLVIQLKSIPMSRDIFEKLSQALRLSDFVKFAKYIPTNEDDRSTFEVFKKSISEIEQIK